MSTEAKWQLNNYIVGKKEKLDHEELQKLASTY